MRRFRDVTIVIANPGADVYGSDLQMLESVAALTEAGARVVVVLPEAGVLSERIAARGAECSTLPFPVVRRSHLSVGGLASLGRDFAIALPRLIRFLRKIDPDVLYVNTTTIPLWILAGRSLGIGTICHVHEAEDSDSRLVLKGLTSPLLFADRLILISETTRKAVVGQFTTLGSKATLVRNGVPDRGSAVVPAPTGTSTRLCYAARLSPRKGTDVAISAVGELVRDGKDVTLEIAGSVFPGYEWYESQLRQQVHDEGLASRVTFLGYANPVFPVFDRANVVLAPSLREPFGNSVVEAQLSERPVVAAAAGGHLESIQDGVTGILVTAGSAEDMARGVRSLIDNPEFALSMGRNARLSALQRFGLPRYREEILEVVSHAMGMGRHKARRS